MFQIHDIVKHIDCENSEYQIDVITSSQVFLSAYRGTNIGLGYTDLFRKIDGDVVCTIELVRPASSVFPTSLENTIYKMLLDSSDKMIIHMFVKYDRSLAPRYQLHSHVDFIHNELQKGAESQYIRDVVSKMIAAFDTFKVANLGSSPNRSVLNYTPLSSNWNRKLSSQDKQLEFDPL